MKRTAVLLCLLAVAALVCANSATAGTRSHDRNGFFIGLGLGFANAGAEVQGLDPERENSVSPNFRFGWAVRDNITIGLEVSAWVKNYDVAGVGDLDLTAAVTTFALTYFPRNMGFYLRGGIGVGSGTAKIESGGFSFQDTETGLGILGAVGYEWRLTGKFALGPQLQYAYLNIEGEGTENVDFVSVTAQATWYW